MDDKNELDYKITYEEICSWIIHWGNNGATLSNNSDFYEFINGLHNKINDLLTIPNSYLNITGKKEKHIYEKMDIVTYCGKIDKTDIYKLIDKVYAIGENKKGYYTMSYTQMGEFLNIPSNRNIEEDAIIGIYDAINVLLDKDTNFSDDKGWSKSKRTRFILKHIMGDRKRGGTSCALFPDGSSTNLLSVFDYCSEKIIGANASGNALFWGHYESEEDVKANNDNVFVLTELPTLLNNSKVTMIDGIDTSLFLSERSSGNEADLVEIFNCLIGVCNKAFSGITGSTEDKANIENLSNKLDKVSKLKEFSEYRIEQDVVLGENKKLDSDEAVDLYFTKRDFNKMEEEFSEENHIKNKDKFGNDLYKVHRATENDDNVKVYVNGTKEVFLWLLFMKKSLKRKSKICK